MYEYQANTIRILDGDTVELDIDLGCFVHVYRVCRMLGINAPEMHGATIQAAMASRKRLASLIEGRDLLVKTYLDKADKYGRLLVEIWKKDDMTSSVNHTLVAEGLAEEYHV